MEKFFDEKTLGQKLAVRLITTSPNTVAKIMEDNLGIEFPEVPVRISLGPANRLLVAAFLLSPLGLDPSRLNMLRGKIESAGRYYPKFNMYIVDPRSPRLRENEMHENIHAFIYQTNPDIRKPALDLLEVLDAGEATNNHLILTAIDRYAATCIFDEGVAEWGKSEVSERFYARERDLNAYRRKKFAQQTLITLYRLDIHRGYIKHLQPYAVRSFRLFQQAQNESNADKKDAYLNEAKLYLNQLAYSDKSANWGPNFVGIVMDYLIGSGLEISEALPLIIKNPPTQLGQLFDPMQYVLSVSK